MFDPVIAWILALGLAILFGSAARHKIADRTLFRSVLAEYRLLPARAIPIAAVLLPVFEVGIAALLLASASRAAGAMLAAMLLCVYGLAIAINLVRGRTHVDCGCGGYDRRERISWALVGRNAALACASVALLLPVSQRGMVAMDGVSVAATLGAVTLLWSAMAHLRRHAGDRGGAA